MIILSSLAENCALNAVLARGCTCSVHLVGRDASTTMQGCGRCLLWPSGHGARPTKMFFLLLCCQILISNILAKQKPLKKLWMLFSKVMVLYAMFVSIAVLVSIANMVKYLENSVLQWIDIFHIKTNRNPKADLIKSKKLILQNFHLLLFFFSFAFTCRNWVSSNFASICEISCLPKPALSNHSLLPLG